MKPQKYTEPLQPRCRMCRMAGRILEIIGKCARKHEITPCFFRAATCRGTACAHLCHALGMDAARYRFPRARGDSPPHPAALQR